MKNSAIKKILPTIISLSLALITGSIFLLLLGYQPIKTFEIIFEGSCVGSYNILKSLSKATPLIFTGLSVFFADQAGLFNIGAEGQLMVGGLTAGVAAYSFSVLGIPPFLSIIFTLVLSFIAGAIWGFIPGFLKAKYNANEFIVSMMLNYVATSLCEFLVTYTFRGPGVTAKTNEIPESYGLPRFVSSSQFNMGFFIGIAVIIIVFLFFRYTSKGYEIKAMGKNIQAASVSGVNVKRETIFVFLIAGGLAALAGATEVMGVHGFYMNDLSPGYGFDGIAVSVLAQGNPFGVFLSSILFGAMRAGGTRLDLKSKVPSEFIVILQALVIMFVATPKLIQKIKIRRRKENE